MRRRPSSTRISSLLGVVAWLAGTLAACVSGEMVDLGSEYDPRPVESGPAPAPAAESGADGPADSPDEDRADSSDAARDSQEADAPAPVAAAALCILNPSFEPSSDGAAGPSPLLADPPQWQACSGNTPTPQVCMLAPAEGSSYLGLSIGLAPFLPYPASVDSTLCAPIEPGVTYSLSLHLALDAPQSDASPAGEPPALQVWGSNTACDLQAELLARFSGATNTCGWKTLCATFVPDSVYTHLILIPEATSSTGVVFSQTNLLVDDLRSGGPCAAR
jgi:hypothetical protein